MELYVVNIVGIGGVQTLNCSTTIEHKLLDEVRNIQLVL